MGLGILLVSLHCPRVAPLANPSLNLPRRLRSADPLLSHQLRNVWNFTGYVTSDTGAVSDIYEQHKYVETAEEAVCKGLVDGHCDIDSGAVYSRSLLSAVNDKKYALPHQPQMVLHPGIR